MKKIKIGFLPLYIKLYDDSCGELRPKLEAFYDEMAGILENEGLDVIRTPFCRIESEFKSAVDNYEKQNADCIVTLHMAYSPSLESAEAVINSKLPVVVMDTTMTYEFAPTTDNDEIDYNHGIHGVMDFCNLLVRGGKKYAITCGHYKESDVVKETVNYVKASVAATSVKGTKVGVFGGSFSGMGDFIVTPEEMKENFDVEFIVSVNDEARQITQSITDEEIDAEIAADKEMFDFPIEIDEEVYRLNTRACLSIRKWIEKEKLDAFSVNFLKACPAYGIDSMPFIEACKAMSRGIGYAGEGDALDAVFCGALIRAFGDASFVEIFCPDWKNDIIFLSHMGEMNYRVADYKPEVRLRGSNYVDSVLPMSGYSRYKAGNATYLNIFRDAEGFCLVASEVEMLKLDDYEQYKRTVRGWMKPSIPVKDFLKKLSEYGATHHSMLVYDVTAEQMMHFGKLLNMKVYKI